MGENVSETDSFSTKHCDLLSPPRKPQDTRLSDCVAGRLRRRGRWHRRGAALLLLTGSPGLSLTNPERRQGLVASSAHPRPRHSVQVESGSELLDSSVSSTGLNTLPSSPSLPPGSPRTLRSRCGAGSFQKGHTHRGLRKNQGGATAADRAGASTPVSLLPKLPSC